MTPVYPLYKIIHPALCTFVFHQGVFLLYLTYLWSLVCKYAYLCIFVFISLYLCMCIFCILPSVSQAMNILNIFECAYFYLICLSLNLSLSLSLSVQFCMLSTFLWIYAYPSLCIFCILSIYLSISVCISRECVSVGWPLPCPFTNHTWSRWELGHNTRRLPDKNILPHCLPAAVYPFNTGLSGMVGNLLIGFSSDLLVFCERKSDSLVKKNKSIQSLFCHERPEWITHSRSFVKSHGSKMLKSLLKKERMSEERWEQFALGYKKGKT